MERPLVDVVCADPAFDLRNRQSAVGSMLRSALSLVSHRFCFRFNGAAMLPECVDALQPADSVPTRPLGWRMRALLPRSLKVAIREAADERSRRAKAQRLSTLTPPPALLLELYRFGSRLGAQLSRRHRAPLIVYFDAPEVEQFRDIFERTPPRVARAITRERETLGAADRVIVYSEPVKDHLVRLHGMDAGRIRVFQTLDHSRMTEGKPAKGDGPPVIGYVGSYMHWHQLPMLIDAFDRLRSGAHAARLLLIGSGISRESTARRVAASPWRADIEMTGFLDGEGLAAQKSRIDIAVLPGTMWYNLPTKVFEYGASGRATVAPRSPTVESLFEPGKEILMFEERNAESLAEALRRLVSDPDLRTRLALSLRQRVLRRHQPEETAAFYGSLFDELRAESARL